MNELSIGEVARQAGLQPSAVRYYERLGLLPLPKRINGRRRYDPDIVQVLTIIQFAQRGGFTLEEIRRLVGRRGTEVLRSRDWQDCVRDKLIELDAQIEQIQQMKGLLERGLGCACRHRLDECVIMDRAGWPEKRHPTRRRVV